MEPLTGADPLPVHSIVPRPLTRAPSVAVERLERWTGDPADPFKQHVGANDPLRAGAYAKTVTPSTTQP